MNGPAIKVVRAAAGLAVLLALLFVVRGWWLDYRRAERAPSRDAETSSTVEATSTPSTAEGEGESGSSPEETPKPSANIVVVLIDGLNFRSAPKDDARPIRGLDKGEKLDLLRERDGWYEVRDADGVTGWVSTNPSYTKTERR